MEAELKFGSEADESVDACASHEIYQHAPIHLETRMAKRPREMRNERQIVDGVADEDGDQVFEPSPGSCAEILLRHGRDRPREKGESENIGQVRTRCKSAHEIETYPANNSCS